jgi:hypothetical protein
MNKATIKALAKELYKNEEVALELANVIFGLRDGDYEPEKFEFKFKGGQTYFLGPVEIGSRYSGTDERHLNHGRYRTTINGTELSRKRNKRGNRLEMLVEYLGGLKEFVEGEENWYVVFSESTKGEYDWTCYCGKLAYSPERVYMTREVAKQVCELLNSGAYSLQGE